MHIRLRRENKGLAVLLFSLECMQYPVVHGGHDLPLQAGRCCGWNELWRGQGEPSSLAVRSTLKHTHS